MKLELPTGKYKMTEVEQEILRRLPIIFLGLGILGWFVGCRISDWANRKYEKEKASFLEREILEVKELQKKS